MDKTLVTAVGTVAILVSVAIAVRWGGLDTSVRAGEGSGIRRAVRRLCVIEVSGIVAGLLVGGFGSRLMMRIIAATSASAAQGRLTEAQEVVGKVTLEGTIGLLLFVGIGFGLVGALVYAVVGRFLPRRAWMSGLVFGLLVLGVFARRDPLDPQNPDFTFLSPVPLAVVLIVALFVLYGATVVALAARLERLYPRLEAKPRSLVAFVPLLLLLIPPLPIAIAGAIVIGAFQDRFPAFTSSGGWETARKVGGGVVLLVVVAGNVWLGSAIVDIVG